MTYKAIIYSVPGTGTRFCLEFLCDVLGYTQVNSSQLSRSPAKSCTQIHTSANYLKQLFKENPDARIVTPIRDPYLSYITRYREALSENINVSSLEDNWIKRWKTLIEQTALPVIFLPVDCHEKNRIRVLHSVARHIGTNAIAKPFLKYVEEWPKVGTIGEHEIKNEYLHHGTIRGERPIFLDFAVVWIKGK